MNGLLRELLQQGPLKAVHLHGILPAMSSALTLRRAQGELPVYFSPHASRSLSRNHWIGKAALQMFHRTLGETRSSAIINFSDEAPAFDKWRSTDVVESPISDVFYEVVRKEASEPLVVVGGRNQSARNVVLFAQLAVLLGGTDLHIGFQWIGSVALPLRQHLAAAHVETYDAPGDRERADKLAASWICVAPGATRGFPLFLVQAMACGLPCVVLDCPEHRILIDHGVTGFIFNTEQEMMGGIAELIDSKSLRESLGAAARLEVHTRFNSLQFHEKLLAAYAFRKRRGS